MAEPQPRRRQARNQPPEPPEEPEESEDESEPETAQGQLIAALTQAVQQQNTVFQALATRVGQYMDLVNPPAGAVEFHRAPLPAGIRPGQLINYKTKEGRKHYYLATLSVYNDDEKYGVEPDKFGTFMDLLTQRVNDLGFTAQGQIGLIPPDHTHPTQGPFVNIFQEYGNITYDQVKNFERTFLAGTTPAHQQLAQQSKMLFDLLMHSTSTDGFKRLAIWKDQFHLVIDDHTYEAGLCLLKVIVRESYLDSSATTNSIRLQLSSLDEYVRQNGTDIIEFNAHVRRLVDSLAARNESTNDLFVNLLKGYKACPDKQFQEYIRSLENAHEDRKDVLTDALLMNRVANYYKKRLTNAKDGDAWDAGDPNAESIVAIQTKLSSLEKKVNKSKPSDGKGKGGKSQGFKQQSGGSQRPDFPPPKDPKDPTQVIRAWKNNTYFWCAKETGGKCGGIWRAHHPSNCKSKLDAPKIAPSNYSRPKKQGQSPKKKPRYQSREDRRRKAEQVIAAQQALLAQMDNDDDDDLTSEASDNSGDASE